MSNVRKLKDKQTEWNIVSNMPGSVPPTGGEPPSDDTETRIGALEIHFEYVRRDLDDLKHGQIALGQTLSDVAVSLRNVATQITNDKTDIRTDIGNLRSEQSRLPSQADIARLPTRTGLWTMTATVAAIALATVGAIIGGLGWLATIIPSPGG